VGTGAASAAEQGDVLGGVEAGGEGVEVVVGGADDGDGGEKGGRYAGLARHVLHQDVAGDDDDGDATLADGGADG